MNKTRHWWTVALALTLLFSALAKAQAAEPKPNILFLFADDHTYEAIRSFGHTDIDTPNLDRLAARGMVFSHAYNMGSWSGAVCVASRTMLITGRSVWNAGAIYDKTDKEREAGVLWPQLMAKAGYGTYMTGKWHIKTSAEKIFDVTANVRAGMPKDGKSSYNRPLEGQPDVWSPFDQSLGGFWEGGKHWSEVVADDTIQFLEQAKASPKPFFMYVAFNAPHDPRQAPKSYVDMYPLDRIALPKTFIPEYPYKEEIGAGTGLRDEKLAPFSRTEHSIKVHRQEYYALITHMDAQIGRILDALEKSGKADNTWIFFTADHGLSVGHHGLLGKQNSYDVSTRVPFIVAGPGVPAGQKTNRPVYLQDVMATSLDLAGAEKPAHVFFNSVVPMIKSAQQASPYESIYGSYLAQQRSITHDGWKLMVYPKANVSRLYHLAQDPLEMKDLASDPVHAATKADLLKRLIALNKTLGDKLDLATTGAP
jgi:choline-sulfatase